MRQALRVVDEGSTDPQPLVVVADTDNPFRFHQGGAVSEKADDELVVGFVAYKLR